MNFLHAINKKFSIPPKSRVWKRRSVSINFVGDGAQLVWTEMYG